VDDVFHHVFGYSAEMAQGQKLDFLFAPQFRGKSRVLLEAIGQKVSLEGQHLRKFNFNMEITISEVPTGRGTKLLIAAIQKLDTPKVKRKSSMESILDTSVSHSSDETLFAKTRRLSWEIEPFEVGDYLIREMIAVSAKSKVHKATNQKTGQVVAVKISEESFGDRIKQEFEIGMQLNHTNIVKFLDCIELNSVVHVFMEYCGQETLELYTKRRGKLVESEARMFFSQVLSAIEYCHNKNVFHGDVKLSNILVHKGDAKLLDFDSSKSSHTGERTTFCGTTAYMAPEMILSSSYSGQTSDMWSLGVCLFVMVTGLYPFSSLADTIQGKFSIHTEMSVECVDLIKKMLTVNTLERASYETIKSHKWMTQVSLSA